MPAPLNNNQKARLAMLARRAFMMETAKSHGRGERPDTSGKAFEAWRHEQVLKAVHKLGLRCCDQGDFLRVRAHFEDMVGEPDRAFNDLVRAETEPRRQAEAVLLRNLRQYGFDNAYAESICLRQFKCNVLAASTDQLWKLIYTVRNRGIAKRKKEAQAL